MNCKPGDIAIVFKKGAGATPGTMVECIRVVDGPVNICGRMITLPESRGPWWEIKYLTTKHSHVEEGKVPISPGKYALDCLLYPIKHEDGIDEVLLLAGYPRGLK